MARSPRKKKQEAEASKSVADLVAALDRMALVQKEAGAPYQTHCILHERTMRATDGMLSVGVMIEDDIRSTPHTLRLRHALMRCGHSLTMTQLEGKLALRSGAMRVAVPCADPDTLLFPEPDPICAKLTEEVRTALTTVGVLATEGAQRAVYASVLLEANTATATNGLCLLSYWHGVDLPPNIVLPKSAVAALAKFPGELTGFGFTRNSATFYFDDNSWLKTQLFDEKWPDASAVLRDNGGNIDIDDEWLTAFATVAPFNPDGHVFVRNNVVASHPDVSLADATVELTNPCPDQNIVYDQFALMAKNAKQVQFGAMGDNVMYFGERVRGATSGFKAK